MHLCMLYTCILAESEIRKTRRFRTLKGDAPYGRPTCYNMKGCSTSLKVLILQCNPKTLDLDRRGS